MYRFALSFVLILGLFLTSQDVFGAKNHRDIRAYKKYHKSLDKKLKKMGSSLGSPVYIRIFKEEKTLEVWTLVEETFQLFDKFKICYFSGKLGPKLKEGDKQSPEGFYRFHRGHLNPISKYHLSFNIAYPNEYDRALGRTGGLIMIHGGCRSRGCFAMTDKKIKKIYTLVDQSLKKSQQSIDIHIFPFRMTDANINRFQDHKWINFWKNLKEGHDFFEKKKYLPHISTKNKKYMIQDPKLHPPLDLDEKIEEITH